MLARRVPTIMPPLDFTEALESTSVHSIAGLNRSGRLMTSRPFRAPHHTTSGAGMALKLWKYGPSETEVEETFIRSQWKTD